MEEGAPIRNGLKLVAGYARAHPWPLTVAIVGSVVYAIGSVLSASALGWAMDHALIPLYEGGTVQMWAAIALILGVMVGRTAGVIVRRYYAGMTAARSVADLQKGVARRLVLMPLDRVRSQSPGDLLARMDADAHAAADVLHPLPFSIGVVSMLLFATVSLAFLDLPLLLATVGLLPIVAGTSIASATLLEKPTGAERAANAAMTAAATEIIAGSQVIKTLGREDAEMDRFAALVDEHRRTRVKVRTFHAFVANILSFVPEMAMVLIVLVGSQRVTSGELEAGGLVQAVALFGVLAFPLQVIGFFLSDLPVSVVGRRRVNQILEEPDDPLRVRSTAAAHEHLPAGPLAVVFRGVQVGEPGRLRLRGVDLAVAAGETLALVGPTAGGKSTVLAAVARLTDIHAGSVEIGGVPIDSIDDQDLRTRVTLASQQAMLQTGTILDNADFGRGRDRSETERSLEAAGAQDLATDLPHGYDTVVGERGVTLSGGQRQRVALARALAGDPGLVLLDDATSAVDPALEEQIIARLAAQPTTVIMVTHRVAAMAAADRVALMVDGRIEASGTHAEMLGNETYRRLVEAYRAAEIS
ncbi:MAG: ABC transporter ATP-binding protein [Acidimicrobiales bacterium]|nr:ABC transporter ATP-binding protein [Acidimicrobiales bacterium]